MNRALLAKWLWRWVFQPHAMWVRLFKERYGVGPNTFPRVSSSMSFICKGWFNLVGEFSQALRWQIGPGDGVLFWEDRWCSANPLCEIFPRLYRLAENKHSKVSHCWSAEGDWRVRLRRITSETRSSRYSEFDAPTPGSETQHKRRRHAGVDWDSFG
ncbi:hypothetical protein QJS10_CPB17g00787 [Acorus calamus]|uniref:Uncharacterized protein n=1 Tax=Acorus calamus TaxID=4465 RepID=A0AAV9CXV2_ACOCL|nr:hypothetical protein QJS10_CPB17g00787 [Acorus calamus]